MPEKPTVLWASIRPGVTTAASSTRKPCGTAIWSALADGRDLAVLDDDHAVLDRRAGHGVNGLAAHGDLRRARRDVPTRPVQQQRHA